MKIIKLFAFLFTISISLAQPHIEWSKCYGGKEDDKAKTLTMTSDGGCVIAGCSESNDGDLNENHGYSDYWIIKLDSQGKNQWKKSFGGSRNDCAYSIQQTNDDGFIVAGFSNSLDFDVTGHHGNIDSCDYLIIKLNSGGIVQWQKSLGGNFDDFASSIQQTLDGGFIVTGWTLSNNADVTGNHGIKDCWIVKLNSSGDIQWQKCYGGTQTEEAHSIQQTRDGGFVIAGCSFSNDGDVTGHHGDSLSSDYWIVKLDSIGNIQWQKSLGGNSYDWAYSIQQISDGYIVAGVTCSSDGDVSRKNNAWSTIWVVKLDNEGNIIWEKSMGGSRGNQTYAIQQTSDGGYILAGYTNSNDGDINDHHSSTNYYDAWIIKLNSEGIVNWQKSFGGSYDDFVYSVHQTKDYGYIVAGFTSSNDGDLTGNHGMYDFWIFKLSPDITDVEEIDNIFKKELSIFPNPASNNINLTYPEKFYGEQIEILTMMGIPIWSGIADGETQTIDISKLPSGANFLRIGQKTGIFIKE